VRGALPFLVLLSSTGFAHDLWVLPGKHRLRIDEITRVFINNGDSFPESLTFLGERRLQSVRFLSAAGEISVSEFRVDGKSLTFDFQPKTPGPHVIVLATRPRTVRMKAEDFEDYLAEEGLAAVARQQKELGESDKPAVERYFKSAKSVVDVGEHPGGELLWAESTGLPFEVVPLDHPNRIQPGGVLGLRVLFDGKPLSGVKLTGGRALGPAREISASTDERGEAAVTVPTAGRWFVRALHVVRLEGDPEVSWESHWASLTFEVAPAPGSER
jgi:uncharacterized GH25 family protein